MTSRSFNRRSSMGSPSRASQDHFPPSPDQAQHTQSHPIAIQLPPRRQGPVYTPPEPLSARGDLPGGYFPLHEDIQRSYKTHPFDDAGASTPEPVTHGPDDYPRLSSSVQASTMTMAIPVGKYHPSNYKNKSKDKESVAPSTQHRRSPSDVRKKLQQHQRDIVEQAATAGGMPILSVPKPLSPQLKPLGSPGIGPMTPMELEEISDGYLVTGEQTRAERRKDGEE